MDRYLAKKQEKGQILEISDLHSIGVSSMFIASKFEDLKPFKMNLVYEKIAHKKLTVEEIRKKELEILKTLNYKVQDPTSYEFLSMYIKKIFKKE